MNRDQAACAGWFQRLGLTAALCVALLVACGGGVGSGGTGSFASEGTLASGPITGFGSIIVDDVHYDDSQARVEVDDGSGRTRDDLRFGMVVEVEADAVRNRAATAHQIRIVSELIGRVDAIGTSSLVVNGLTVHSNAGTVYDAAFRGGLAGVPVGAVVAVYGFSTGATGEVLATRIEPQPDTSAYRFRGTLSMPDAKARTFRIGSQVFVYAAQLAGHDQLANGALIRVLVEPQRDTQQRWIVASINGAAPQAPDGKEVKANGLISAFDSLAHFQVDAWTVDASAAKVEGGPLAVGQHVKIEGTLRGGVLAARDVRVLGKPGGDALETQGRIVAIDPVARTFDLNGNRGRVSYARSGLVVEGGTLDMLAVGTRVTVTGQLSADGTFLEAQRIVIDDH